MEGDHTMLAYYVVMAVILIGQLGCVESSVPPPVEQAMPRPVIISSDTGVEMDDMWTLAHVALSPEFDLLGVVAAHGPVIVKVTDEGNISAQMVPPDTVSLAMAAIARSVLDHLPIADKPPVYAGANSPLENRDTPSPSAGLDFILRESRPYRSDERLTVLMLGPATDVASAILADSTIVDRIEVVAMAYNKWPQGTDVFNVHNDILAWQILMHSRTPLVVGDSTVTATHLKMTRDKAKNVFTGQGIFGVYISNMLVSWLDNNRRIADAVTGDPDSWPVWDEVTLAYMMGLTSQQRYPRPVLRDDMTFDHPNADKSEPVITWITNIDSEALWMDFSIKLEAARQGPD